MLWLNVAFRLTETRLLDGRICIDVTDYVRVANVLIAILDDSGQAHEQGQAVWEKDDRREYEASTEGKIIVQAFVGQYGSVLVFTPDKGTNIVPYLPERDIYFCDGVPCAEESPGAVPSGWIGAEN